MDEALYSFQLSEQRWKLCMLIKVLDISLPGTRKRVETCEPEVWESWKSHYLHIIVLFTLTEAT